mmetsp:Transcript_132994/g.384626  ORF Transcript_132994/g.384626 Transcript_132994/m.384626 type:complete len:208 (-) Transcript_132994:317-940(-)
MSTSAWRNSESVTPPSPRLSIAAKMSAESSAATPSVSNARWNSFCVSALLRDTAWLRREKASCKERNLCKTLRRKRSSGSFCHLPGAPRYKTSPLPPTPPMTDSEEVGSNPASFWSCMGIAVEALSNGVEICSGLGSEGGASSSDCAKAGAPAGNNRSNTSRTWATSRLNSAGGALSSTSSPRALEARSADDAARRRAQVSTCRCLG